MSRNDKPQFSFSPTPAPEKTLAGWLKPLVVVSVVLGGVGTYLYFNQGLIAPYLEGTSFQFPPTVTVAYKWRDAEGNLQLTGTPPLAGTPFETIRVNSSQNVMPLVPRE
jgi:hypothetical protein